MQAMDNKILQHVPDKPDSTERYLFYLHGLIVEEAGIRPKSDEHGYYEYQRILEELARKGFTVISEARKKGTEIKTYAEGIVSQIKKLLAHGVAPENITVVGASKGGAIGAYISTMLREKEINYLFLAGLFEKCLVDASLILYGNVLSIHDRSDKLAITPGLYFQRSAGLGRFKEMVLELDLGHGLIYQPYREWIEPFMAWLQATAAERPRLHIIGVLHGDIASREDAPKNFSESTRTGTLEIYPAYQEGLDGIVAGQTIVVLFWLHQSRRDTLKVYPRGDKSRGLSGVFNTRSPVRPNPLAISELKVLAINGNLLEVSGLDILDGTPIVDIKKKLGG
jgi:L-fuculose-phosphate aldolase